MLIMKTLEWNFHTVPCLVLYYLYKKVSLYSSPDHLKLPLLATTEFQKISKLQSSSHFDHPHFCIDHINAGILAPRCSLTTGQRRSHLTRWISSMVTSRRLFDVLDCYLSILIAQKFMPLSTLLIRVEVQTAVMLKSFEHLFQYTFDLSIGQTCG